MNESFAIQLFEGKKVRIVWDAEQEKYYFSVTDIVQSFAERLARVDEMFGRTRKAFDDLATVTAPSGQSIVTAARQLLKYGAQENRKKASLPPDSLPPTPL